MKKKLVILLVMVVLMGTISSAENVTNNATKTVEQAMAWDYTNGEKITVILERYRISQLEFFCMFEGSCENIQSNTKYRTLEQAIAWDYTHGEKINTIVERYGIKQKDLFCLIEASCDR